MPIASSQRYHLIHHRPLRKTSAGDGYTTARTGNRPRTRDIPVTSRCIRRLAASQRNPDGKGQQSPAQAQGVGPRQHTKLAAAGPTQPPIKVKMRKPTVRRTLERPNTQPRASVPLQPETRQNQHRSGKHNGAVPAVRRHGHLLRHSHRGRSGKSKG